MRVTMSEIARLAGVSPATVDRVLNDRAGVRGRTRSIVMEAAHQLGYFGLSEAKSSKAVRIVFFLPEGPNSFMRELRTHLLEEAQARPDVSVQVEEVVNPSPDAYVAALRAIEGKCDAIGIVAPDHPMLREELTLLSRKGVRIATLVSDISAISKIGYVGIDNRAAGRLAGLLLGRFLNAGKRYKIAVFVGSLTYRGHEEREMGFRSMLAEDFPELEIVHFAEVSDDRAKAYQQTKQLLERADIDGIYSIGAGNQGIVQALKETRKGREIVFIGHDLTDTTRTALLDRTMDAVIDQNPRIEAREILRMLSAAVRGQMEPEYPPRLQVIFRENIPMR